MVGSITTCTRAMLPVGDDAWPEICTTPGRRSFTVGDVSTALGGAAGAGLFTIKVTGGTGTVTRRMPSSMMRTASVWVPLGIATIPLRVSSVKEKPTRGQSGGRGDNVPQISL